MDRFKRLCIFHKIQSKIRMGNSFGKIAKKKEKKRRSKTPLFKVALFLDFLPYIGRLLFGRWAAFPLPFFGARFGSAGHPGCGRTGPAWCWKIRDVLMGGQWIHVGIWENKSRGREMEKRENFDQEVSFPNQKWAQILKFFSNFHFEGETCKFSKMEEKYYF